MVAGLVTARPATNLPVLSLGTITMGNAVIWETPMFSAGYRIYLSNTNQSPVFQRVDDVSSNIWPGTITTNINGWKFLYVTAYNAAGLESDPSEIVLLEFRAGVPLPPTNLQLYSVVRSAAANALPVMRLQPPAIPSLKTP